MSFYADPPARNVTNITYTSKKDETTSLASERVTDNYKIEIKWLNVFIFIYLHIAALYGLYLPKHGSSITIGWVIGILSGLGTTVGSHRLFTHRTFKANQKLKVLLVILQTMSLQEPVLHWVRDHRVHHKYTDTNADPYNSRRGFFFSHMGWLMCKKHPDVVSQGKKIDMSDLQSDPVLLFQQKYYLPFALLLSFFFPAWLVCYFGDSFNVAWNGNIYRYVLGLHMVWMVNSIAHLWGDKPYDKNISPTDTYFVGFFALGEGWHNYHHIFPWDYKTAEMPGYMFNLSTSFIDFFAWIGWATELKTVPENLIKNRIARTGDGSHPYSKENDETIYDNNNENKDALRDVEHFWGFGDDTMTAQDMKNIKIL